MIMVPKRRGKGYLKTPYGHHIDPQIEDVIDRIARETQFQCDLDGTDLANILIVTNAGYRKSSSNSQTHLMNVIAEQFLEYSGGTSWLEVKDIVQRSMQISAATHID